MQKADFINFRKYYQNAAVLLPKDSFYQDFITHKVIHSAEVLRIGRTIMRQMPELNTKSADFKLAAERALLFHDVGRFDEGVLRWQAENNQEEIAASSLKINHCDIGYNILLKAPAYNDPRILAAVKFHGRMMEEVCAAPEWQQFMRLPEKEEIKQILFLTRDADKLANLRSIKKEQRIYHDIFYKQLSPKLRIAPLSKNVIEQFMAGKTILFPTVTSFADRILMVISWFFDINYLASLRICKEECYFEYLLKELKKFNKNKELQNDVVEKINQIFEELKIFKKIDKK